jgi:hypothetical protein
VRGILCNWLVCLAVWQANAAQDIISKAVAVWLPISAFVAMGFEHCIANMVSRAPSSSPHAHASPTWSGGRCMRCGGCSSLHRFQHDLQLWRRRPCSSAQAAQSCPTAACLGDGGLQAACAAALCARVGGAIPCRCARPQFAIPLSMKLGSGITTATFITANLIPVTLGNLVGGALPTARGPP